MPKGRILLEEYTPLWSEQFESLKGIFERHLSGQFISIEHVGSTAIRGMKAKPIIDIDIVVENNEAVLRSIISRLTKLGYVHVGNKGIPDREAFKKSAPTNPLLASIDHHLYVCKTGCMALLNHLYLRDYLRQHPDKVFEYSQLKVELSSKFPCNMNAYIDGKTDFILSILSQIGMKAEDTAMIGNQNRLKPE